MRESINIDLLLPEGYEEEIIQDAAEFVEGADEYSLLEKGEDITGTFRIIFSRNEFNIELGPSERGGHPSGTTAMLHVQAGRLKDTTDLGKASNLMEMVEATKDLYLLMDETPALGYGIEQHQPITAPLPDGEFPPSKRKFISWLDIYSPEEVETIGKERLLSAPAFRTEQLDDGSVLVVSKHPTTHDSLDDVADHIGIPSWEDLPEMI